MSGIVSAVLATVSNQCCITRCRKEGCSILLPNKLRPSVVIDMDSRESPNPKNGKRCDFLFFGEGKREDWVVPMELQKGNANSSKIVPQLRAGALVAEMIVPKHADVKFRPVAAYGGGLRRHELTAFRNKNNKVRFRKQNEFIRLIRCGTNLVKALRAS